MPQATPLPRPMARPLYPRLVPVPYAFFVAALVTDLAYWRTDSQAWETFSVWLIAAGLLCVAATAIAGLVDLARGRRRHPLTPPWPHVLGDTLVALLALVNVMVHSRDGYTAVVPTGLILSALVLLVLVVTRLHRAADGPADAARPAGATRPAASGRLAASGRHAASAPMRRAATVSLLALLAFACGLGSVWAFSGPSAARVDVAAQYGADPVLPQPHQYLLPPMAIAPDIAWGPDETPVVPRGLKVEALARGLKHPRSLAVLPNGDILVVETSGPPAPVSRPKDLVMGWVQTYSGAHARGANRITLIRPAADGVAPTRTVLLDHLTSPFGVALVGHDLYVADTDALLRFPYVEGDTTIAEPGTKLCDLPGGPIDHHWTKSLVASPDGTKLYVGVGSNSNITENGIGAELDRADILEVDRASGAFRVFAAGLRNPNGLTFEPRTGRLWAVVNERDELGPDLVPDYLTSVRDGGFYGWPYSYYGQHVDARVQPQRPDLVARAIVPDYALSSHVAPLGLVFDTAPGLPDAYRGGAFVAEHGSWDRTPLNGYKVVFVPFRDGRPDGAPQDVVTGFLDARGRARGRPVGLALDRTGALLVADDLGDTVWRISAATE